MLLYQWEEDHCEWQCSCEDERRVRKKHVLGVSGGSHLLNYDKSKWIRICKSRTVDGDKLIRKESFFDRDLSKIRKCLGTWSCVFLSKNAEIIEIIVKGNYWKSQRLEEKDPF